MKKRRVGDRDSMATRVYDAVAEFKINEGRWPELDEVPELQKVIDRYYGSFDNLKYLITNGLMVQLGGKASSKKTRFCRYCGKKLPFYRWFFCDNESPDEDTPGCLTRYRFQEEEKASVKKISQLVLADENDFSDPETRKATTYCQGCVHPCKVTIPIEQDEINLTIKIICPTYKPKEATDGDQG